MDYLFLHDIPLVRKSHDLTIAVYKLTRDFPREEAYGLTSQVRRAAASIPANICEGRGHSNDREMLRYLNIARGSLAELSYLLVLAKDIGYITSEQYTPLHELAKEIGRMSAGFHEYLRKQIKAKAPTLER